MADSSPRPHIITRRHLLGAGGAGLVIGAVATEIGNVAAAPAVSLSSTTPPDVDLMEEHGILKRVLLIYEHCADRITTGDPASATAAHGGATIIHDFIESFHEALEEGYVFPLLRKAGQLIDTVDTLLVQHARGRQLTQTILAGTNNASPSVSTAQQVSAAMTAFVRMYQPHEAREDTVVFPALRALLTPQDLNDLGVTFSELQRRQFGPHGFSETLAAVVAIEQSLGIYDLDQFTPPEEVS